MNNKYINNLKNIISRKDYSLEFKKILFAWIAFIPDVHIANQLMWCKNNKDFGIDKFFQEFDTHKHSMSIPNGNHVNVEIPKDFIVINIEKYVKEWLKSLDSDKQYFLYDYQDVFNLTNIIFDEKEGLINFIREKEK